MNTPAHSALGQSVDYPRVYDPGLLFAIARAQGRAALGIDAALPFVGTDRWHAYELGWLDAGGKPCVATARIEVPADSPQLIESRKLMDHCRAHGITTGMPYVQDEISLAG